jgi:hypothetical protein
MTRDASLQRLIAAACLRADGEDRLVGDFDVFCKEFGVDPRDAEALKDTAPRLAIYRRLVRNNVADVCAKMMPRTHDALGAELQASIDRFLQAIGPRSHYLRDVPHELFAHASPSWPPAVRDLAAWELAEYAVAAAPRRRDRGAPTELVLDRPVLFDEAVRMLDLDHAVHAGGEQKKVHLLVYRDVAHAVRALELTPLAAALTRRLISREPLGAATKGACDDVGSALTDDVLASIARLLSDFAERGALLGAIVDGA